MAALEHILAKSPPKNIAPTDAKWCLLQPHLAAVHAAAAEILHCTAAQQLKAVGIDPTDSLVERLSRIVLLAAALHDLGKASSSFQEMIRYRRRVQPIRHEWLTLEIIEAAGWAERLREKLHEPAVDWEVVRWSISGHHPAYGRQSPPQFPADGSGTKVRLLTEHHDFSDCVDWLNSTFGLDLAAHSEIDLEMVGAQSVFRSLGEKFNRSRQLWAAWQQHKHLGHLVKLTAVAKACLIAADVGGSVLALSANGRPLADWCWVGNALRALPTAPDYRKIAEDRLGGSSPHSFQQQLAGPASGPLLVKAGCGSGKTIGAYLWAAKHCAGRRLYFCYPTTGTATQGFGDYLLEAHQPGETATARAYAALFHSRREVDLDILNIAPSDEAPADDTLLRRAALEAWSTGIVSCTVDTVLGLTQNSRRSLFAWPALCQSGFVFDEIHAYDDRLFGALLRFVAAMPGVPILFMSASLSEARATALAAALGRSAAPPLTSIEGPAAREQLPRYQLTLLASEGSKKRTDTDPRFAAAADRAVAEMAAGGKVLWVCNTVERAMRFAEAMEPLLQAKGLSAPLRYHSRFKYIDRVKRHKAVVERFRGKDPVLAVCTQVAEMSLDLSASLLITDLAPAPALIQRLGRLNRYAGPGDSPGTCLIIRATSNDGRDLPQPYNSSELSLAADFIAALGTGPLSQHDLAEKWKAMCDGVPPMLVASAWLDGGPSAEVLELREASPGITVILEQDIGDARARSPGESRRMAVELAMPMPPPRLPWQKWPRFHGVPVAPGGTVSYSETAGARWADNWGASRKGGHV